MPRASTVVVLAGREMRDAWRNRWFLLYAVTFALLALGLAWLSVSGVRSTGFAGLGRTAASLVNLVVLIVPLMGLSLGAQAIAAEREAGSLLYLLAHPVDAAEVVLGKFVGLSVAVVAALLGGFGVAAGMLASRGGAGDVSGFLAFVALAALLAMASVGLGLLISAFSSRAAAAAGVALFVWLTLIVLGDLGLMASSLAMEMGTAQLLAAALVNPLQVFKIAAVLVLRGGLEGLGPAGLYAMRTWGDGLVPVLVGLLVVWIVLPVSVSVVVTRRRGGVR